jgi:hypothetical protein
VALCCGGDSTPDDAASRLGLPADLVQESETYQACDGIYPDNLQTVGVFMDMLTQWRVGPAGATGLDYTALPVVMGFRGVRKAERSEIFEGVQIMERAALKGLRERK